MNPPETSIAHHQNAVAGTYIGQHGVDQRRQLRMDRYTFAQCAQRLGEFQPTPPA